MSNVYIEIVVIYDYNIEVSEMVVAVYLESILSDWYYIFKRVNQC
jgi:hypothetical protein